jgi:hypothetical protein
MKKAIIILSSFLLTFFVNAQQTIFETSSTTINGKLQPAIHVVVEPEVKDVNKAWETYVKDVLGQKLKGNKDEQRAEAVNIPQLSDQMVNLYSQTKANSPSGTNMYVALGKGNDAFFNPNQDSATFNKLSGVVKDFLRSYLPSYYNAQIAISEKAVAGTQKTLTSLSKTIEKSSSSIAKNDEKIKKLEESNTSLKKELDEATKSKTENDASLKTQTETLNGQKSRFEKAKALLN